MSIKRNSNKDDAEFSRSRYYHDLTLSETIETARDESHRTLTTFTGVLCPVALAQFSTILFLRAGYVVGQTGFLLSVVQLILAYMIIFLTILSICAISSNGAIKGGGVYFMISRTLGPEVGGSIGILFFLANVFSCALYISGFVEGLIDDFGTGGRIMSDIFPDGVWWRYLYSTVVCVFCVIVCLIGASMYAKTSFVIFVIVMICYLSAIATFFFQHPLLVKIPEINHMVYPSPDYNTTIYANFTGLSAATFRSNLYPDFVTDFSTMNSVNFLTVFGVLFSGVTGIMNGANMSGDLKNPSKSIPLGTMVATVFTFVSYFVIFVLTAATCDRFLLHNNYLYLQAINFWRPFVMIGIFATTLSAALGNLIGASRVLNALAKDEIFGIFLRFAKISTKKGNPIVSVLVAFALVEAVLLMGKLNVIAPAVSVFFLMAYASVNLVCSLLDMASASNFRPTFKYFTWQTSLLGVIACVIMCFLINFTYAIILFIICILLIVVLYFRRLQHAWGNIGQALLYHQVRKYLLLIDTRKSHVKYWRPQMLLLVSNPRSQATLIKFINILKKGGLYVLGHVIKGNFEDIDHDPTAKLQRTIVEVKDYLKVKAFVDVTVAPSIREGCRQMVRLSGLGGMEINTVCLGFCDDSPPQDILENIKLLKSGNQKSNFSYQQFGNIQEDPMLSSNILQNNNDDGIQCRVNPNEETKLINKRGFFLWKKFVRKSKNPFVSNNENYTFLEDLPPVRLTLEDESVQSTSCGDTAKFDEFDNTQLSALEFVGIIEDSLKLGKDVCICRHFDKMDYTVLKSSKQSKNRYVDVWPINFFQPGSGSYIDNSCKLMLQLSCILGMRSRFKVRLFICMDYYTTDPSKKGLNELWNDLLALWRINAKIKIVPWDDIIVNLEHGIGRRVRDSVSRVDEVKTIGLFDNNLPNTYINDVNNIIKMNTTKETAVCFFYLPELPAKNDPARWSNYLTQLTLLTNDLPPSVLVRGQHEVLTAAF